MEKEKRGEMKRECNERSGRESIKPTIAFPRKVTVTIGTGADCHMMRRSGERAGEGG